MRRNRRRTGLLAAIATVALAAVVVPAAALAAAEHILIPIVDQPTPGDLFEEPCTGTVVHGIGIENGQVKITELGPQGHHVQLRVDGEVVLLDDEDDPVGTWTYHIRFSDLSAWRTGSGHVHRQGPGRVRGRELGGDHDSPPRGLREGRHAEA